MTALLLLLSSCSRTEPISIENDTIIPESNTVTPIQDDSDTPSFPIYTHGDTLDEKLQNAVAHIHQAGLSGGTVTLDEEIENIHGEIIYLCHDDAFYYSINSKDFNVDIGSIRDWDALYANNQDALDESGLTLKAHQLADILFLHMNIAYTDTTSHLLFEDIGAVQFHMYERRDDCLVNIGTLELSKSGVIISFTSSSNSFDDFKDSNRFTKDEIHEIAFRELQELKIIIEASGGVDPGAEYGIINLPPSDTNAENFPTYEMYLNTIDDITFVRAEKIISGDRVFWFVEAQVKTSWGSIDTVYDFIWVFQFDVDTGERVGYIQVVSGA
jgi:hypothetical protein